MLLQKNYSEDFKEETVKLVLNSGKSQAQIGRELGVNSRKRVEMEREILKKQSSSSRKSSRKVSYDSESDKKLFGLIHIWHIILAI